MTRSGTRGEHRALAAELRRRGATVGEAATVLRDRYGLGALAAARTAGGWSQAEVAAAWSERWPDDPKTFKNVSYWENWPAPTGHAPSLAVLDRLARLYGCTLADLVAGWGEHGPTATPAVDAEREALIWQVEHLDLHELSRSISDWAVRLPAQHRRDLLLKLSTAASLSAIEDDPATVRPGQRTIGPSTLTGRWSSTYTYASTSRGSDLDGVHVVELAVRKGRLVGRSEPQESGSRLTLDLTAEGNLITGSWVERTSPVGHYRAATYHGVLQLVVDPMEQSMTGMWLGITKRYTIKSGRWALHRLPSDP